MKKLVAAAAKITKLQLDVARLLATHWVLFLTTLSSLPTCNTRSERQKVRGREGMWISLDYFLLIRGIEFLRTHLIFIIRISSQGSNRRRRHLSRGSGIHEEFSEFQSKLSSAGKITPLTEHETNHSQLLW